LRDLRVQPFVRLARWPGGANPVCWGAEGPPFTDYGPFPLRLVFEVVGYALVSAEAPDQGNRSPVAMSKTRDRPSMVVALMVQVSVKTTPDAVVTETGSGHDWNTL